ncbi:tyrosine--tRNA ligase [Chondrinema litorale]|uniref:tyrosine--tRNA ligase n=1 Tax=Chondrinema litorale TaxID=2994555 RepID=UPI0025436873|nr:tyrosine--tRNA ligase [Chondrinema litorale]UZR98049.1 tyrosine--tRNA ligase [Chondrinema litorale]
MRLYTFFCRVLSKRFTENTPIAMHELVYPVLQGFDSLQIKSDIEMGGTDQLFNCTMGRQLQESHHQSAQIVMCMALLRGLDGKEKMSKSLNNIIGLTDEPNDMFGKVMSIPDSLISEYLDLATDFSNEAKKAIQLRLDAGENPMEIKKLIAKNIISQYHNAKSAEEAEAFFSQQFQNKNFEEKVFQPFSIADFNADSQMVSILDACYLLKNDLSKTAVRRLIQSGAVQVDNEKIMDEYTLIKLISGKKFKIGKRDFFVLE